MTRPAARLPAILLALLLLTPLAFAQSTDITVADVEIETDPFTGEESCLQFIGEWEGTTSVWGFMPKISTDTGYTITFGYDLAWRDLIFDEYAIPEDDRMLVRVDDDIFRSPAFSAWYDVGDNIEGVTVDATPALFNAIADTNEPVIIRLESDYSGLQHDVTLPMQAVRGFQRGFARLCLP